MSIPSVTKSASDRLCYEINLICALEEAIAKQTNPDQLDGNVSRRGAITAALSAGDWLRALTLVDIFLSEPAPPNLAHALVALRDEAEQELSKVTPPDVRPVEFHLAAA